MSLMGAPRYADQCMVCGSAYARTWRVREMAFGTNDEFTYGECSGCGALIILHPPADPGRYYPASYPPFSSRNVGWRGPIRRLRNRLVLDRSNPISRFAARLRPHPASQWLARTGTTRQSRVLDVGAGGAGLLHDLAGTGFRHLVGVDRFIPEPIDGHGFRVIKGTIDDIEGEFDLIMFHHSLEHMSDQRGVVARVRKLLATGGWCLIRLPVVPNDAWQEFRENWVQLDAPRHEIIHSVDSLTRLAGEAGLTLDSVEYDSTAIQFALSEMNRRGSKWADVDKELSRDEMRAMAARAVSVNRARRGDQAVFYFRAEAARPNTG